MRFNNKKYIYLISPLKINKSFYNDLIEVLKYKKVSFFQLRLKRENFKKKLSPSISARRKGDPPILISSPSKIKEELGWSPKYHDIKDIISHTYNWLRKIN